MSVLPAYFRTNFQATYFSSFQYTFLIFAGLAVASAIALLPMQEEKKQPKDSDEKPKFLTEKSIRQISRFSLTLGLVGFASGVATQLLSLWFKNMYGVNEAVLGPWFAAAEITSIIVVPLIPRLTRGLGTSMSVLLTQGLSAVLLGSMILSSTYELAGVIYIVRNFFMNISWPVQQSYLMGTVEAGERASASAITTAIWGVGGSIGPIFAGYFLSGTGYASTSAPLLIGAAVYLASALAFYLLFRRTPPPEEAVH
jgi:predicted MFS family arabinose efflux permease